jgi:hypothetical protein
VDEVLIDRGELGGQDLVQEIDDLLVASNDDPPLVRQDLDVAL